ncbi:putative Dynein axonemal heavy chain 6 [Blattamonas nauphoetae]|uniref:Dynein axonemal heavy chain 6 n=1 Tax=Blattamonas nauphoetae TaxID=2049346 RepID=A0ABQ9X5R7_9EUKA|nr:putative Dynein axonemal heavy chain 6 [Blattamonas nauphoetae]
MEKNNEQLDLLQKKLQDYLETKRVKFPRFYFLSNDELLQILAQTTDARAVQPFMNKCFDAISSLQFCSEKDMKEKKTDVAEMTPEEKKAFSKLNPNSADFVTAMVSVENEVVPLLKPVPTHSPVEEWLLEFKHEMCRTINVAILAVDQIVWTQNVEEALTKVESGEDKNPIDVYSGKVKDQLAEAVNLVRGSLAPLERATINTVIVIDVHARDIVNQLLQKGITSKEDFDWMVNLRYNFDEEKQITLVKQTNTSIEYGNEYFGNSPRLVITPLTDRCDVTLTLSLHLRLGGNPAVARQCVVFNYSDEIDYMMMGRFFSGLVLAGAWACFDEFNRIDIDVLSVIAQHSNKSETWLNLL